MLHRPPSLPNLGTGHFEGVKPNPLLTGYGALRDNVRSPTQSGSQHGGSILHDYTFRGKHSNSAAQQTTQQPQFQVSKNLPAIPPNFLGWAPAANKYPNEVHGPLRATPLAVNPTGQSSTGGATPLAPATTPLTGSFFRQQELSAADRPINSSVHMPVSARPVLTDPFRHPRPEESNEISNLKSRLSEAHSIIEDLRRQLAQEKQLTASLQSRLQPTTGIQATFNSQNGRYQNSAPEQIQTQIRNPFGGTAFTTQSQTYAPVAISNPVAPSGFQTAQQSTVSSQQPIQIHSSLGHAASVGVLPRTTNESVTAFHTGQKPPQDQAISRTLFTTSTQLNAVTAPQVTQTTNTVQPALSAANVSVRLDNTLRRETQEDTLGEQTSSADLLRSQNKLKEANQRIRYLAEENDRLVARLLQLKTSQSEQQKIVEQLTSKLESNSAGKSDVEAKQAQLEADLVRQHEYSQELLAVCQHLQRELEQERSKHERPTEGGQSNFAETKPSEPIEEVAVAQVEDAPKKKKKKVKELDTLQADQPEQIDSQARHAQIDQPKPDDPAEEASKPKKKKKATTEAVDSAVEAPTEEKPKKKKKKEEAAA